MQAEKFKERCPRGSCSRRNQLEFVFWALSEGFTFVATRPECSLPILWWGWALSGEELAKPNVRVWHTLWQGCVTCPTWHSPTWLPRHPSAEHLHLQLPLPEHHANCLLLFYSWGVVSSIRTIMWLLWPLLINNKGWYLFNNWPWIWLQNYSMSYRH